MKIRSFVQVLGGVIGVLLALWLVRYERGAAAVTLRPGQSAVGRALPERTPGPLSLEPRSRSVVTRALPRGSIPSTGHVEGIDTGQLPEGERLAPARIAFGLVERSDRTPASDCHVTLGLWPSRRSYAGMTDERGRLRIAIESEQILGWDLHASDGMEAGAWSTRRPCTNDRIDLGKLVLQPAAELRLHVRTYRGEPLSDTAVLLAQSGSAGAQTHLWRRTDQEGTLRTHLEPGPVFVTVSGLHAVDAVEILDVGFNEVLVYANEARSFSVSVLTDESHSPIAGAQLELGWPRDVPAHGHVPEAKSIHTHSDPRWRTDRTGCATVLLPPDIAGTISVFARSDSGEVLGVSSFTISDLSVEIRVPENATLPRRFSLRAGSAPIPPDGTRLACQSGLAIEAVVVDEQLEVSRTANTAFTHVFGNERGVIVLPAGWRESQPLTVEAPSPVALRLLDTHGQAVSGAMVRPVTTAGERLAEAIRTDGSGHARWEAVPPLGAIHVVAWMKGQSGRATVPVFTGRDAVQDVHCERGRCYAEVFIDGNPEIPAGFDAIGFHEEYSSRSTNTVSLSWLADHLTPLPLRVVGHGVAAEERMLYPQESALRIDFVQSAPGESRSR